MNIFVLDESPDAAARMVCDKHVVKMPLETAQLLCTDSVTRARVAAPYKPTHFGHPLVWWVGSCREAWDWTLAHGVALCDEYSLRYGREHACMRVVAWAFGMRRALRPPPRGRLVHLQCLSEELMVPGDPVAAYRRYYVECKAEIAEWRHGGPPDWWPMGA